jgi:hypothetical protein
MVIYKKTILSVAICAVMSSVAVAAPPRDFSNISSILTAAGFWTPIPEHYLTQTNTGWAVPFTKAFPLGTNGAYGMAVTAWGTPGDPLPSVPQQTTMGLLVPNPSGLLTLNTAAFIDDPVTNGGGSIIIADFNGDGKPDIFLAAHNEQPFVAVPSTAYLSNPQGPFTKVTLSDHIMAHDAQLVNLNGNPVVITGTFGPGDGNPIYSYANGNFTQTTTPNLASLGGMDGTLAAFGTQGELRMLRGDVGVNWHPATNYYDAQNIEVYPFEAMDITSRTPLQVMTPYLSTLPQYQSMVSMFGPGISHTYRLWNDDLNHDGIPDVLAGVSMYGSDPNFPNALDVWINDGTGHFVESTSQLNPDMPLGTAEFDYTPTFLDLDNSGINTYLITGGLDFGSITRQSNYVLLNDGTGRIHVALHSQFEQMMPQIDTFLQNLYPYNQGYGVSTNMAQKFIAIPQLDGTLNFIAMAIMNKKTSSNIPHQGYVFVNVPLHYNPSTEFTTNVTISNRNGSKLIRTWAGNDAIVGGCPAPSNTPCSINGGLGVNTMNYGGARSNYAITTTASGFTVKDVVGNDGTDNMKNIQVLNFAGYSIDLRAAGSIPAPPTLVNLSGGTSSITVSFTAPTGDTSNFTGYTATCSSSGLTTQSATGSGSPIVVTGLVKNKRYSCSVHANTSTVAGNESSTVTKVAGRPNLAAILGLLLD